MSPKLSKYSALRGEREYFKLLAANAVNRFGDSVDSIALSLLMYEVTGSASMMALLLAVNYLPTIILQPIVEGLGMEWAFAIDMGTFFFSGAAIAALKMKLPPREDAEKVSVRAVAHDMADGLKYLRGSRLLWAITMLGMALNFIATPVNTFYTPFVTDGLGGGATLLSATQLVQVGGVAVGALIVPWLEKLRIRTTATVSGLAFALMGVVMPALLLLPTLAWRAAALLAVCLVEGLCLGVMNTLYSSRFMMYTDKEYLSRTTGVTNSLLMLMSPAGSLICSAAAAVMSVPQCLFYLSLGCAVLFYIVTRMRAFKVL